VTELFKHQKEVLNNSDFKRNWALFMEAGTGKTLVSIRTAEYWFTNGDIEVVIVICPKSLIGTWAEIELPKHSEVQFNTYKWNPSKVDKQSFIKKLKDKSKLFYFIMNHDAFVSEKLQPFLSAIKSHRNFGIIYDESTAIKNFKADRTQNAIDLGKYAQFRRILSGTPIVQSPLDVFSQTEFLSKGALGFKNFYGFKTRYAIIKQAKFGTRSFEVIEGYRDLDDLRRKLDVFSSFVKLEDCIDLPEQVFKQIHIELTYEQKVAYEELRDKALLYIEEHEISVVNALSMIVRLNQILSGQLKLPDGNYAIIKNNRIDTVKELVENESNKVIVWSNFVGVSRELEKALNKNALLIASEHSAQERQSRLEKWRNSDIQCLILSPASSGHGLTLTEAKSAIFVNHSYNLEYRLQALRRNYRIGQDQKTVILDFLTPNTIEEKILAALDSKKDIAEKVTSKTGIRELLS